MKIKTKDVQRQYQHTDAEASRLARVVIQDSRPFIRILTDD